MTGEERGVDTGGEGKGGGGEEKLGVLVHTSDPSSQEAETGGSRVQDPISKSK